jgi:16S rRNA (uracil1498-N3)-methyltransferase
MARFFIDAELSVGTTLPLPKALSHHALRTLRMADGDGLTLFNGRGGEYAGRLLVSGGRNAEALVELQAFDEREAELPFAITVAQGLSGGDKMEWTIEKAVELGATAIQPLACARSVVRLSPERAAKRLLHWRALCEAASAQCGRNRVPAVHAPLDPQAWLAQLPASSLKLLLSPRASTALQAVAAPTLPVYLMVGPEGGFTPAEEDAAQRAGFLPVSVGPRVLRTETAAAAALAMLYAVWTR